MHRQRGTLDKARAAAEKKEEEEKLVRQLLGGQLANVPIGSAEHRRIVAEVTHEHNDDHTAPASPLAMSRVLGRAAVDKPTSVAMHDAVELERARRKALDRVAAAMEAGGKGGKGKGPRTQESQDQEDEDYYFQYEKLQELRDELNKARRDISHEKFGANSAQINALLAQNTGAGEDKQLGDWETYENVQKMLKGLLIRRQNSEEDIDDMDSPAFLALLKHKLSDARQHIDDLRRKVRELTSALKVAGSESKSAQVLLSERNEDVEKQRNTITVLQLQLKNFKNRQAAQSAPGASPSAANASKDELMRDLDQLRQEYQDLADVNLMLEKQMKMLRIKAAFVRQDAKDAAAAQPGRKIEFRNKPAGGGSHARTSNGTVSAGVGGDASMMMDDDDLPTTGMLMKMLEAKRRWNSRVERAENATMAALDSDAGAMHRVNPIAAREAARKAHMGIATGGAGSPRTSSLNPSSERRSHNESPQDGNVGSPSGPGASRHGGPDATPEESHASPGDAALPPAVKAEVDKAGADKPKADTAKSSRAWILLRQKLVTQVALSRADVLRREEAHIKHYRRHTAHLTAELSQITSERDNLNEKLARMDAEVSAAKEQSQLATARAERLQALNQSYLDSAPGTAQGNRGSRAGTAENDKRSAEEKIASLRGEIVSSGAGGSDGEGHGGDVDAQVENIVAIFTSQVQGLKQELSQRDNRIKELSTQSEEAAAAAAAAMNRATNMNFEVDDEDVTRRRLESEVLAKDRALLEQDRQMKVKDLHRLAAEDALYESRAVQHLGMTEKGAARVVPKVRDWVHAVRQKVQGGDDGPGSAGASPSDGPLSPRGRHGRHMGHMDQSLHDAALLATQLEEQQQEERSLLNQMLSLSTNPTVLDHVAQLIEALDLDDVNAFEGSIAPVGDALSRNDKQWAHMRRLWLRLLTVREQAWQNCLDPTQRKRLQEKVVETYAAFLKFEQLDQGDTRPSFCSEGAMRTVSFATAPIAGETIRGDEVHREYTALKELVKSRAAQQLQLESQRDELYAQLDRIRSTAKKQHVAPQSALYILHKVEEGETSSDVAVQYGLTNVNLVRQTFAHAPRQPEEDVNRGSRRMYVPVQSATALTAATETEGAALIVRHLVQSHDTINAIATQYGVQVSNVCRCGTMEGLSAGEFVSVCDVIVPRRVAQLLVHVSAPENPLIQPSVIVLAALPKHLPPIVASRTFNIGVGDIQLYNEPLERGVTVRVPLVFSKSLVSLLPDLLESGNVAVMHENASNETLADVAAKYGVDIATLQTEASVAGAAATMVPLTDFVSLTDFVFDDATAAAIEQVESANRRNRGSGGGNSPVYSLDTPLTKLMCTEVDGAVATEDVEAGVLARVGSIRQRRHSDAAGLVADRTTEAAAAANAMPSNLRQTDVQLIEHRVIGKERLEHVARRYHTLREDIVVPNFQLLDGTMATWAIKIHNMRSLQKAREYGANVHCVVDIVDESLVDLASDVTTTPDTLRSINPELDFEESGVSEPITGRVRVPVLNPKMEQLCLRRSGEFYAVVSALNASVEGVASAMLGQPSDVVAFDVQLQVLMTPIVKVDCTRKVPREHCLLVTFPVMGVDLYGLSPEHLAKLRSRIERDILSSASLAQTAQTPGEVEAVTVASIDDKETVTVAITCSTQALTNAVQAFIDEDGPLENLEQTVTFINDELEGNLNKLGIVATGTEVHHFRAKSQDCYVAAVHPSDTLACVALRLKVGVGALLAYNPDLMNHLYSPSDDDDTAASLEGISHLRIPGAREKRFMVKKGDTLTKIAERGDCSVTDLKRLNAEQLPLLLVVNALRIPVHSVDVQHDSVITIRTHGAESESLLALATRHGVALDDIRASVFNISLGTVLRIPSTVGCALASGHFRIAHPVRDHRCENGDTLEAIAEQYGLLVDEIKYANASRLRIPPRTYVGLRAVPSKERSAESTRCTFVRHTVQDGETLEMIANKYFQPITSILGLNSGLYEKPDAHRILVPIAGHEADDVLTSQASNLFTIIQPGPYDTLAGVARKFMINQDRVSEVNQLLNDPHRMILPIISPMAGTIARQKHLPLFVGVELARNETLVSIADRYGVAVKDLRILGKPLKPMGVATVDVPVSHDVATQLMKASEADGGHTAKVSPIYYRTQPLSTESIQSVTKDFNLPAQVDATQTAAGLIEVPLMSADALETARKREATMAKQRNQLAQKAMEVGQALRQLTERNEATKRELAKVEAIRASQGTQDTNSGPGFNKESTACQTDEYVIPEWNGGTPQAIAIEPPHGSPFPAASLGSGSGSRKGSTAASPAQADVGALPAAVAPVAIEARQATPSASPAAVGLVPPHHHHPAGMATGRPTRRNGATQTKLLAEQLVSLEESAASSATKLRFMEVKADEAQRERNVANSRLEDVNRDLADVQAKLTVMSDELKEKTRTVNRLEAQRKHQRDAAANMAGVNANMVASATAKARAQEAAKAEAARAENEKARIAAEADAAADSTSAAADSATRSLLTSAGDADGQSAVNDELSGADAKDPSRRDSGAADDAVDMTSSAVQRTPPPSVHSAGLAPMTPLPGVDAGVQTSDVDAMLDLLKGQAVRARPSRSPIASLQGSPQSTGITPHDPKLQPASIAEDFAGEREQLIADYEQYIDESRQRSAGLLQLSMRGVREEVTGLRTDVQGIFGRLVRDLEAQSQELNLRVNAEAAAAQKRKNADQAIAGKIFTGGSAVVASRHAGPGTRPEPVPPAQQQGAGRKVPNASAAASPKAVTDVMASSVTDSRPDEDLDSKDWITRQLSGIVLGEIATGRRGSGDRDGAASAGGGESPSSLPVLKTAPAMSRNDSTVSMRENVLNKVLGPGQASGAQSARPSTHNSDTSSRSYSEKPAPIAELMRLSDNRHGRTPRAKDLQAPTRLPTPPDLERDGVPPPRPGHKRTGRKSGQNAGDDSRTPTPPAAEVHARVETPRLHPRTPREVAGLQDDIAKLVTYAADQNEKMLQWQTERRSSTASTATTGTVGGPTMPSSPHAISHQAVAPRAPRPSGLGPEVEELAPLVNVVQRLQSEDLSAAQKAEVADVRAEDKRLRREQVGLMFQAMTTKLELRKVEARIVDVTDDREREGLVRIAAMWRRWLDKWNTRRTLLFNKQRKNLQRLVDMFLVTQQQWETMQTEQEEATINGKTVRHDGTAPRNANYAHFGASRPDLIQKGGILVVRPHRPGSKWLPIQPPETSVPGNASSKHFQYAHM